MKVTDRPGEIWCLGYSWSTRNAGWGSVEYFDSQQAVEDRLTSLVAEVSTKERGQITNVTIHFCANPDWQRKTYVPPRGALIGVSE